MTFKSRALFALFTQAARKWAGLWQVVTVSFRSNNIWKVIFISIQVSRELNWKVASLSLNDDKAHLMSLLPTWMQVGKTWTQLLRWSILAMTLCDSMCNGNENQRGMVWPSVAKSASVKRLLINTEKSNCFLQHLKPVYMCSSSVS